jgi:hypothetical protein
MSSTQVHSVISSDGTICVVVDGKHYTVSASHPSYSEIRTTITSVPFNESRLIELLNINKAIAYCMHGKVRVDLNSGKVWFNDTEFCDKAFCERILRVMAEGQDPQYLLNFLNNLGENPEFRSIMETFKFICNEGMPITEDGCFLGYKGVRADYYDKWSGTIQNTPDGRRVEMPRTGVCNDPSVSCDSGLHVGSYRYAKGWAGSDGVVILVKVNPKDVVSVPNHECEKLRACGYWCVKQLGIEASPIQGEVYDKDGNRMAASAFVELADKGQFDYGDDWDEQYDVEPDDYYDDYGYDEDEDDDYYDDDDEDMGDEEEDYDDDYGDEDDDEDEDEDDDWGDDPNMPF